MSKPKVQLAPAYQCWFQEFDRRGFTIWLVTLLFKSLNSSQVATIDVMEKEAERGYRTVLTRVIREPRRADPIEMPALMGSPDRPVLKHIPATRAADAHLNSGVHYHLLITIPPKSRLKAPLDRHIQDKIARYKGALISTIHLKLVTNLEGRLVDYVLKHHKRGTYSSDNILILPRARSELMPRPSPSFHLEVAPHELRAAFRHLLADYRDPLLAGHNLKLYTRGGVPALLLAIVPITNAVDLGKRQGRHQQGGRRIIGKLSRAGGRSPFTMNAAQLVISGVGQHTTQIGSAESVLRDLEALFSEIVLRDVQFQSTPTFRRIAAKLAPLCSGDYHVVWMKPV